MLTSYLWVIYLGNATSEKTKFIEFLTESRLGFDALRYLDVKGKTKQNHALALISHLTYNSLASIAFKNLSPDSFVAVTLREKAEGTNCKVNTELAMLEIRKLAQKYELKIPKLLLDYEKGSLGFFGYVARQEIILKDVLEVLDFFETLFGSIAPEYLFGNDFNSEKGS